ncbi:MAG TPA: secondary thiamine-phosphate synthase enzyme YjbQ [Candidatus Moranbacteria bacterium]|nr:secondary thiamine-phosphate synthase enzyme YjbQ [Candidatus Moranbacteria bacterium]HSA07986.1 secondary thiamine-phosphate synthase enzyme YjbQ [Candidatus Moranbacteria bacterium]
MLSIKTHKQKIDLESKNQIEFFDITDRVQKIVDDSGVREGNAVIFAPHTTMGVVINHNETMLLQDFMRVLYKFAPTDDRYSHDLFELRRASKSDGRSNGHSHCKSLLIGVSQFVPIEKGKLMLGPKQSIFAVELDGARERDVTVNVLGI